mgnify:CR=1 FL=1
MVVLSDNVIIKNGGSNEKSVDKALITADYFVENNRKFNRVRR